MNIWFSLSVRAPSLLQLEPRGFGLGTLGGRTHCGGAGGWRWDTPSPGRSESWLGMCRKQKGLEFATRLQGCLLSPAAVPGGSDSLP